MPLSSYQKDLVAQDLLDRFMLQFGDDWQISLTRNLRPSPIHSIARERGVSPSSVRKILQQIHAAGQILRFQMLLSSPSVSR